MVKLYFFVMPIVLVAVLQVSGCTSSSTVAAPPGGTYLSTSAGAHFDQSVNRADASNEFIASYVLFGADRPVHSPDDIYIAAGRRGIVYSINGGAAWQVINTPLTNVTDVVSLANGILVGAGTDSEGQGFVIRSADNGLSWESVLTIPVPVQTRRRLLGGNISGSQSVVISIAPNPFHDNQVYAGTSLGNVLVGEQSAKTWRTINTLATDSLISTNNKGKFAIQDIIPSPHVDGEVLLITSEGEMFRISPNEQVKLSIPRNLNSTRRLSSAGRPRAVRSASFIPEFPDALLIGVDDGAVISRDRGQTWQELALPVDTIRNFNSATVAVSPTNSRRLFVGINSVIYRSEDGGISWNSFSLNLKAHAITSLLIDPANAARVLVVTTPLGS